MTLRTSSPLLESLNQPAPKKPLVLRLAGIGYRVFLSGVRQIGRALYSSVKVMRNVAYRTLLKSDYQRWTNLGNYEEWWDSRTEQIARLIPPTSRVIEFGAGRRQLDKFLDPSCIYVASDLTDRGPGTFVCDLNRRPLPDLNHLNVDTAVFSGVLEYIHDLDSLVKWLAQQVSFCVASYACAQTSGRIVDQVRGRLERFYFGYMNNFREEELVDLFRRAGFRCNARDPWTSQRVFLFKNQRAQE